VANGDVFVFHIADTLQHSNHTWKTIL